ncbi:transcriptional regulator, IclR family [Natronoarchaeum philippinense]|uniref:Transcriptional regulator, IclR family n=1 Tax=Natronoarchaeum philippinense TaxID=558529 RepID=A0A285PA56_NATPI|nr:IclR family transcriptional regulator [Natronoarchaeum philippinense]SNZ17016.1 transcriptional regulator, IclR family [Natronoarchaeum philippinense]
MTENSEIKAVQTAFEVVSEIREADGAVGVSELARQLDIPVSTVHSHLKTLHDCEYVVRREQKYDIGYRFLEDGGHRRSQTRLYQYAKPKVDQLADEFEDKVSLCVFDHGYSAHVYIAKGDETVETDTFTGVRLPIHTSAGGKAILASLPEERVEDVIERRGLDEHGPNTITSREELLTELDQIREEEMAYGRQERIEGIRSVAAPITQEGDQPDAAISVAAPISRMTGERFEETIPERLTNIAQTISIKLRYA